MVKKDAGSKLTHIKGWSKDVAATEREITPQTRKAPKGCRCKENLLAALNLRGDMSKGEKDRCRDLIQNGK